MWNHGPAKIHKELKCVRATDFCNMFAVNHAGFIPAKDIPPKMVLFEHHFPQVQPSNAACLDLGGKFCWLNYELKPYHTILVRTTDSGKPALYKDVYLNITLSDVNDQPRSPQLSGYKVHENMKAGTPIGTFTAFDEDTKQTLTYSLVDDDQGRFKLVGSQLQKALPANYETKSSHKITLLVKDDGNPSMSVSCFLFFFFSSFFEQGDFLFWMQSVEQNGEWPVAIINFNGTCQTVRVLSSITDRWLQNTR